MSLGMPGFDVAVECYVGVVFIHYSRDPLHHTRSIPTADVGWACVNPGVMSSVSDWRLPRGIPSVGSERRGGGGGWTTRRSGKFVTSAASCIYLW